MSPEFKRKLWLEILKAAGGALLVGVLIWLAVADARSRSSDLAQKRMALNSLLEAIDMSDELKAEALEIENLFAKLQKNYPSRQGLADYFDLLEKLAQAEKLGFLRVEPKDFNIAGDSLPLNLELSGSYKGIQNFLLKVAVEFPAIRLDKVELNRKTSGYLAEVVGLIFLIK